MTVIGRRQMGLPARMAWLGMVVGAALVLEPVIFSALGGAVDWRNIMSNNLILVGSIFVLLFAYVGFPIWAFWLGRTLAATRHESALRPDAALPHRVSD